jgi:hypothetical protein
MYKECIHDVSEMYQRSISYITYRGALILVCVRDAFDMYLACARDTFTHGVPRMYPGCIRDVSGAPPGSCGILRVLLWPSIRD